MGEKLTPKERMDRLRAALREDSRPTSASLAQRLDRCAVDWKGRFECRSPACLHCRRRHIARERRVIRQNFGHLSNDALGFVSVVVGGTAETAAISGAISQSRESTRKRVAACRDRYAAWNHVYLSGWHEIDAVGAFQLPLLPPKRRALVERIAPLSFDSERPAWITTFHAIVHRNGLSVDDIACEFSRQWKLEGQVHVRAFDSEQSVEDNLDHVTSYANKFGCSVTLKDGFVDQWPVSWEVEYFGWLQKKQRNPFEALRLSVNPRVTDLRNTIHLTPKLKEVREPMPCLFSRVSTYDYTGAFR